MRTTLFHGHGQTQTHRRTDTDTQTDRHRHTDGQTQTHRRTDTDGQTCMSKLRNLQYTSNNRFSHFCESGYTALPLPHIFHVNE
jgi:hypothetical protein